MGTRLEDEFGEALDGVRRVVGEVCGERFGDGVDEGEQRWGQRTVGSRGQSGIRGRWRRRRVIFFIGGVRRLSGLLEFLYELAAGLVLGFYLRQWEIRFDYLQSLLRTEFDLIV